MKQIATLTYNYQQRRAARSFILPREVLEVDVSDENAMETTVEIHGSNDISQLNNMLLFGDIQSYKIALDRAA